MRVVKNPEERKAEILSAAIRVFARKGYDKTSISDIAKEIGISQGLCYRYYTSKEEIYDAALDEYADYIARENLRRYDLRGKTLKEMIQEMSGHVDDYVEFEQEQRELFELFHKGDNKRARPIVCEGGKEAGPNSYAVFCGSKGTRRDYRVRSADSGIFLRVWSNGNADGPGYQ